MRDVLSDPAAAAEVMKLGFATLPVVLTPDSRAAAGADPAALTAALPLLAAQRDIGAPDRPSGAPRLPAASGTTQ